MSEGQESTLGGDEMYAKKGASNRTSPGRKVIG